MNEIELAIVAAFLDGEHPALDILRAQLESADVRARETSEFGFLTDLWVPDTVPVLDMQERFALDDVFGRVEGVEEEVGFLLHVVRGRAKTLEGFVALPVWPVEPKLIDLWHVVPDSEQAGQLVSSERRDLRFALRGAEPRVEDEDA